MIIDSPIISGSLASTGSLNQIGNVVITGSLTVTGPIIGSITGSADSASFATTASYALSASHAERVDDATSASYAISASHAERVDDAISSSYAITSSYSLSGSYSFGATSASYAASSTSASYALNSTTAVSSSYPLAVTGSTIYSTFTPSINFSTTNSVYIGNKAGDGTGNSYEAVFIGKNAGSESINGNNYQGIFIGTNAGVGGRSNQSVMIGAYSGVGNSGGGVNSNVYLGTYTGYNATNVYYSSFIGPYAGQEATNAYYSNFIGSLAGYKAKEAYFSTFFGGNAGYQAVSASYSVILGYDAGYAFTTASSIGDHNIIIGHNLTLPVGYSGGINIGGLIFGSGSYKSIASPYYQSSGSANGKIGINQPTPLYNLDVSGSGNFTNGLTVTGSLLATSITSSLLGTASYASQALSSSYAVSASYALSSSYAANADLLDGRDSLTYANTGSNTFTNTQYINAVNNAVSFTSTASLYTDGGVRVTKDMYVSGTAYFNNVTVFGTQSINYITSSQLNISTNIISVNTDTPSVRFGGLAVYDSGSTGLSGSLLWDSEDNHWVYSNPSGSTYDGGMLISGPRNTSGLGNEVGTTACAVIMGQGGDHITSSAIFHYGNATCFYGNSYITSSGGAYFSGNVGVGLENPIAKLEASKFQGHGLRINYCTDQSVSAGAACQGGIYAVNCGLNGYPLIIDEVSSNVTGGQYPVLIRSLASAGTPAAGMATGIHFGVPDNASNVNVAQMAFRTTDADSGTYTMRWDVRMKNLGSYQTNFIMLGDGSLALGTNGTAPSYKLDVSGCTRITGNACIGGMTLINSCLGIGTATPQAKLDIGGTGDSTLFLSAPTGAGGLIKYTYNGVQQWYVGTNAAGGGEQSYTIYGYTTNNLNIVTNSAERLRITSTGIACFACRVCAPVITAGTGTSSQAIKITGDDNYIEFDNVGTYIKGGGNLSVAATSTFLLSTSANTRLTIAPAGEAIFACQVCAPTAVFTKSSDQIIRVETTSVTDNARIDFITPSKCYTIQNLQTGAANALIFYDLTAASERMRISSAGNVGIGITCDNPIVNGGTFRNLLLGNGEGYGAFQGVSTATAVNCVLVSFSGGTTGASGYKNAGAINVELDGSSTTNATGRLGFYTGVGGGIQERLRIASTGIACFACTVCMPVLLASGCVGIGTTSISSTYGTLTVAGTGITIADDGNAKLQIGRYSAAACNAYIKMGTNACSLRFTNAADTVDVVVIEKGGNVGVGTSSPSAKLHTVTAANADGIYLSRSTSNKQAIFIAADDAVGAYIAGSTAPDGTATQADGAGRLILQGGQIEGFQFQTSCVAGGAAQSWQTRLKIFNSGITCFACQVCAPSSIIKGTINEQLVLDFVAGVGSYTHQSFRLCGTNQYRLIGNTNGNFILRNDIVSSDVLTFACTGIATFACQVCSPAAIFAGCVGIGTTTPKGRLHLTGIYDGAQNSLNLENNWPNTHYTSLINFWAYYNTTDPQAVIEAGQDSSATNAGVIMFKTMNAGASPVTRMRITPTGVACFSSTVCAPLFLATGCVAIGTSGPSTKLHVVNLDNRAYTPTVFNDTTHAFHIQFCDQNQRAGLIRWTSHGNLENSFGVVQMGCATGAGCGQGDFVFQAYRTAGGNLYCEVMRITNQGCVYFNGGGSVGIGTASPNEKLDVNGTIQIRGESTGYATTQCVTQLDFYLGAARLLSFGGNSTTCGCFRFYAAGQNNSGGSDVATISGGGVACFRGAVCASTGMFSTNTTITNGTLYLPSSIAGRTAQIEFGNSSTIDILGMPNQTSTFYLRYGACSILFANDSAGEILRMCCNRTIAVNGPIIPASNGTIDLGTSSLRWCTVYTSDLSLSNGIGDYTIVEGENDLFLYNNKQCKVYKFVVQEVCPEIAPAKRSI